VLVTTARRSDRNAATGLLARETLQRDKEARRRRRTGAIADTPGTGRAVEHSGVLERTGGGGVERVASAKVPDLPRPPMDPEQLGVTRRQFFNRSITLLFTAGLGAFGASILAFLWPSLKGGFGSKVKVAKVGDILAEIEASKGPKYVAEARTYLVPYPKEALVKGKAVYSGAVLNGMEAGVVAIYQKCVHLGCRVPWCGTSQWFECPCHGSQYNRVGEYKAGPAPRGLDRFAVSVDGSGLVTVDTAARTEGPPQGTNTTGQESEGPHCISAAGGH